MLLEDVAAHGAQPDLLLRLLLFVIGTRAGRNLAGEVCQLQAHAAYARLKGRGRHRKCPNAKPLCKRACCICCNIQVAVDTGCGSKHGREGSSLCLAR